MRRSALVVLTLGLAGCLLARARAGDGPRALRGEGKTGDHKVPLLELYTSQG